MPPSAAAERTLFALARYFLILGASGFGGPAALVARMHDELVTRRGIVTEEDYRDGLALAQLAPGPLAAQLAIYIGWAHAGVRGAATIGIAFIAPSLLMVLAIAALYMKFNGMPWISAVFYGIGAAVIAIITRSVVKLSTTVLADRLLWALFAVNALFTALTGRESVALILGCGSAAIVLRRARFDTAWLAGAPALLVLPLQAADTNTSSAIFAFFAKASMVVFGSGLAVIPFLYGGVVVEHAWLTEQQFVDAIAVSMITPGPVVITVAFIGFLIDGWQGGLTAAAGMFVPTFLAVVLLAPFYVRIRDTPGVRQFVDGITAAATGAIAGSVVVLAQRSLVDVTTLLIALTALLLVRQRRPVPEPLLVLGAGVAGFFLH